MSPSQQDLAPSFLIVVNLVSKRPTHGTIILSLLALFPHGPQVLESFSLPDRPRSFLVRTVLALYNGFLSLCTPSQAICLFFRVF